MRRRRFTLLELLVTIAVIAILAALLLPALGRAREYGRGSLCGNNERQIGLAVFAYANDHGDYIPPWFNADTNQIWCVRLYANGYLSSPWMNPTSPLVCPSNLALAAPSGYNPSNCFGGTYGVSVMIGYYYYQGTCYYSGAGTTYKRLDKLDMPSAHFYVADKVFVGADAGSKYQIKNNLPETWPPAGPTGGISYAHIKAANFLFLDGHVERIAYANVPAPPPWDAPSPPVFPW